MTQRFRERYAKRLGKLAERLPLHKQAFYQVIVEARQDGVHLTRRSLYRWCSEYGVKL
jgi:hypothetical protein